MTTTTILVQAETSETQCAQDKHESRGKALERLAELWDAQPRGNGSDSWQVAPAKRLIRAQRFQEALALLDKAPSEDAEALNLRGIVHEALGRHDQARKDYGRALAAEKGFWPAEMDLRRCYELWTFGASDIPPMA